MATDAVRGKPGRHAGGTGKESGQMRMEKLRERMSAIGVGAGLAAVALAVVDENVYLILAGAVLCAYALGTVFAELKTELGHEMAAATRTIDDVKLRLDCLSAKVNVLLMDSAEEVIDRGVPESLKARVLGMRLGGREPQPEWVQAVMGVDLTTAEKILESLGEGSAGRSPNADEAE